jgi:hypothetical protein
MAYCRTHTHSGRATRENPPKGLYAAIGPAAMFGRPKGGF